MLPQSQKDMDEGQDASFSMCPAPTRENFKKVPSPSDFGCDYSKTLVELSLTYLFFLALGLDLDVMVLDFEDGVALNQKSKARQLVADTLKSSQFGRTERTVRINSIKAGEDLYVS